MRSFIALLVCALAAACGFMSPPLPSSHDSIEALSRAVLQAIERRDTEALSRLALNEEEFREHVWPELPAARPERNLPFSYVWRDLHQKSGTTLTHTLAAHGGKRYQLVSIRFTGESTPYRSYLVHRESELAVKDQAGTQHTLRMFGSVIEKRGRFKVFSYVVDD
jgi:hypothetical protein